MICNNCGHQNGPDAKFCGGCGNALIANQNVNNSEIIEQLEDYNEQTQPTQVTSTQEATPTVQHQPQIQQEIPAIQEQPQIQQVAPIATIETQKKSNKKKIITIIIIFVAIVLTVIGAVVLLPNNKTTEKENIDNFFDPEKPIRVKDKNQMYRYIDQEGKYITNNVYLYATEYYNNYAIVTTETIKDDIKVHVDQIIDKNGNVKKETQGSIEYHEKLNLWLIDYVLYDSNLKQISPKDILVNIADDDHEYFEWVNTKNNTGGIMNSKGEITYTYHFQEDEDYISVEPTETDRKDKYCIVGIESDKSAIVNCDDGTVVYDYTEHYIDDEDDNIFEILDDDTYDLIEIMYIQDNKIVYKSTSEEISIYYNEKYLTIRDGSKDYDDRYSYIDLTTLQTSKEIPDGSDDDYEDLSDWEKETGYKKFSCSDGYGIIEKDQILIQCNWDYIDYLDINVYKYLSSKKHNYIITEKDDNIYITDINSKKQIATLNTSYIIKNSESLFIYYTDKNTKETVLYNLLTNKTVAIPKDYSVYIYSNYAVAKDYSTDTTKYYNNDGKLIYTEKN